VIVFLSAVLPVVAVEEMKQEENIELEMKIVKVTK
jgi:hypothetical protein